MVLSVRLRTVAVLVRLAVSDFRPDLTRVPAEVTVAVSTRRKDLDVATIDAGVFAPLRTFLICFR